VSFAIGVYQALGAGRSPEQAFRFGCAQVRIDGWEDHDVLLLVRPDGTTQGCD
jgi:hypothetical protein